MTIRLENVTKRYGRTTAVDRLELEVQAGEMMVLLGPSGCGKSTSLRLVAGLEELSEGVIYIGERRVNDVPPQHRDVAMVFQNYALYPHMSVAENIGYPLRVRKKPADQIAREVRQVAATLGLDSLLGRRPRQLSGGERQRVALARAIIRQPVAFLMDEPLSNLDANLRLEMRAELKRLQRQLQTTTLYVTHDQAEAMTLASRIAVLRAGRLLQVGTPMELYRRPLNQFVAGFLGTPPMNFLEGRLEGDRFRCAAGAIPLSRELREAAGTAESLILGFRPQEAVLASAGELGMLRGSVYVTEEMGEESVVFLTCGREKILVSTPPEVRAAPGENIGVTVPAAALYLFDGATGRNLLLGKEI
jgi:multiple sugar transport system ATP-binding protein